MKFTKAIVRTPSRTMVDGLTTANLGPPQYELALAQHGHYVQALESAGLAVTVLEANEQFPDSTFVEDTALLTPVCAIVTRPGAQSRRGETEAIETALAEFYPIIERVESPGTVDAGDILMVGTHYYIGQSQRTNSEGTEQVIQVLESHGMTGSTIALSDVLHLKSGVAYLENNRMVAAGEFLNSPDFAKYDIIEVDDDEQYGTNCLRLNDTVLVPAGFPKITAAIEALDYHVVPLEMSEFQKLDGGLSCLSLRF